MKAGFLEPGGIRIKKPDSENPANITVVSIPGQMMSLECAKLSINIYSCSEASLRWLGGNKWIQRVLYGSYWGVLKMRKPVLLSILMVLLTETCLSQSPALPGYPESGLFSKTPDPILKPEGSGFESKAVYNPSVIVENDMVAMLYRAEGTATGTGVLCLAFSPDGKSFDRYEHNPIISSEYDYETFGCEDPRIARIDDTFYLTYVGNDHGRTPGDVCLATSPDLKTWTKHGEIIQPSNAWDKSKIKAAVIVPERINGKYVMYFLGEQKAWETSIGIAYSDDLIHWEEPIDKPVMEPRVGFFDSQGTEPGATPVVIDEGILLIYNGWDENHVHKTGWVLFSKENPTEVIDRCEHSILEPELDFEKTGYVNNVTFAEGIVFFDGIWHLYYGAADTVIGHATTQDIGTLFQPR